MFILHRIMMNLNPSQLGTTYSSALTEQRGPSKREKGDDPLTLFVTGMQDAWLLRAWPHHRSHLERASTSEPLDPPTLLPFMEHTRIYIGCDGAYLQNLPQKRSQTFCGQRIWTRLETSKTSLISVLFMRRVSTISFHLLASKLSILGLGNTPHVHLPSDKVPCAAE